MSTYDEQWKEPYEEHPDAQSDRWQRDDDDREREQDERDRKADRGE